MDFEEGEMMEDFCAEDEDYDLVKSQQLYTCCSDQFRYVVSNFGFIFLMFFRNTLKTATLSLMWIWKTSITSPRH